MEQMEKQNEAENRDYDVNDQGFTRGQTMSMSEAVAKTSGNEMAVLDSLNRDSQNSALGALFEYETA